MYLLSPNAGSRTSREWQKILQQLARIWTQPSLRIELLWVIEDPVIVHQATGRHTHNGLRSCQRK